MKMIAYHWLLCRAVQTMAAQWTWAAKSEFCVYCTCPKSWLCPSHDTNMPERSLKTAPFLCLYLAWIRGTVSDEHLPFQCVPVIFKITRFPCPVLSLRLECECTGIFHVCSLYGALGFLCMEIYNFTFLLWQMGTKFDSVAFLLVGRYLRLVEITFSGVQKKAFCLAILCTEARFTHPQKSSLYLYVCPKTVF